MKIIKTTTFKPYTILVENSVDHGKLLSTIAMRLKNMPKGSVGEAEIQSLLDELRSTQT